VTPQQLRILLAGAMTGLAAARDELRDLDAAIGDGDLGITVSSGAQAVSEALATERPASIPDVLRIAARAFARANPSTMSGLTASALIAAARVLDGHAELDRDGAILLLEASIAALTQRGGAELGDKTVLDAVQPSLDVLRTAPGGTPAVLDTMIRAARSGVEATTSTQARRGRAAWLGERSAGHADGGATAYVRFLESLAAAWPRLSAAPSPADLS
jgi:phosphoenolpyruvate---glycerone phosphotransferase subunit DhaL